jgi:hypothetical protein
MRKGFLILLGLLILSQQILLAEDAALTNIVVTNNRDDLLLYLNATGAFNEKTRKAILSGVPTTFTFYITLNRDRDYWLDKKIVNLKISHVIEYDNLKKVFHIDRSWDSGGPVATSSFEEAQQLMIKVDSLKIVSLGELEKGEHYQIRAKAELSKFKLPLHLHRVLFFLAFWDVETDWYAIDFTF